MIGKLDLYRIFWMVGNWESFSKAANELYLTQPAVSQAIAQLERELETRLFNRTPKGVSLTNEGMNLYEHVQSALDLIDMGEEKILEFKQLTTGELKIGVSDTISRYFLLPYLEMFHNDYPNITFKINNGTTSETIDMLKSGTVDIAICNFPIEDSRLEMQPFLDVQDIFVYGEKFKQTFTYPVSFQELVNFPLIFLEPKSNSRSYVEHFLLSKGVHVTPEFELGSHDLLLEFASINLGVASVTKEFSREYLREGLVHEVPLIESIPKRNIGVCFLKGVPLAPAATKFVDTIETRQIN